MNTKDIVRLYRRVASELPEDVLSAIKKARDLEHGTAREIMDTMIHNCSGKRGPLCQDTGTPTFYVACKPEAMTQINKDIDEATDMATEEVPLRPNSVDVISERTESNKAVKHIEPSDQTKISLILKGGGSENVSNIYRLPDHSIGAERNLDGVRRCVIDCIHKAQGKGCPPYFVGVGIAGDIESAAALSKKQLLRKVDDQNKVPELQEIEEKILEDINKLGIGPQGLGGRTTAISVKGGGAYRHPASYFVGISIGCWCMRRGEIGPDTI